jgi:hypothetical protein
MPPGDEVRMTPMVVRIPAIRSTTAGKFGSVGGNHKLAVILQTGKALFTRPFS